MREVGGKRVVDKDFMLWIKRLTGSIDLLELVSPEETWREACRLAILVTSLKSRTSLMHACVVPPTGPWVGKPGDLIIVAHLALMSISLMLIAVAGLGLGLVGMGGTPPTRLFLVYWGLLTSDVGSNASLETMGAVAFPAAPGEVHAALLARGGLPTRFSDPRGTRLGQDDRRIS